MDFFSKIQEVAPNIYRAFFDDGGGLSHDFAAFLRDKYRVECEARCGYDPEIDKAFYTPWIQYRDSDNHWRTTWDVHTIDHDTALAAALLEGAKVAERMADE